MENETNDPASCWEANADIWTRQSRAGYDIYRDALNTPAFLDMLPDVRGLKGIDIGCGEGSNTRQVAKCGAHMCAIDIAPSFIRYARETETSAPLGISYQVADALSLPFPDAAFDFAVSFMCLMDVSDPAEALREIARVLRPGGFVQFSILHPCFAPPKRRVLRNAENQPYAIEVADYFATGRHVDIWCFSTTGEDERRELNPFRVPYVHLTLGGWLDAIHAVGFRLEKLGEPRASKETASRTPEVADTRIAPLFLHVRAIKAAAASLSGSC